MFLVGAGALHIPLLSQCGLELGLGLRQDQRAHQPVLELDGEDADLLSIGLDVLRQDLPLGVQPAKRVVALGHIRRNREPDHCHVIDARRGLSPRRFE